MLLVMEGALNFLEWEWAEGDLWEGWLTHLYSEAPPTITLQYSDFTHHNPWLG